MEHLALLVLVLGLIIVGVLVVLRRSSKTDPLDQNPMRGTTRRGSKP